MLTPRLERLKNQIVNAKPQVYAERALLVTQAYGETENEPPEIQKARAMEKIFRQSTVLIKDDELIVGCKTPTALGSPLYPEFNVDWTKKEIDTGTVTDAIAAIDHFVFGKGAFSADEIVQAMKDNFKGHETMRNLLWNKALKLGNDRDEVDRNAARLVDLFVKLLKGYTNDRGVPYGADMIPTTAHLPFGVLTAASADGRLAGAPLSEGISPVQGQDLSGPTAVVKSMAKLDHASTVGSLLNLKFTPQTLAGKENLKKLPP